MDFTLDENQQAVADLSNQIFSGCIDPVALGKAEEKGEWFDEKAYLEVAKAGLLGIAISEDIQSGDISGGGLGVVELGQVLEAQGRHLAPLPLLETCLAGIAIDRFGTDELRKSELPSLIDGTSVLTLGIQEWYDDDYLKPQTVAVLNKEANKKSGDATTHKITGTKIMVEFIDQAQKIVVSATEADTKKPGLYLVDLNQAGISMNEGISTRHQKVHEVVMTDVEAIQLPDSDLGWFINVAVGMLCSIQLGVCGQALKMSAEYTSTREQFGRPIATFQAVTHRLADQYINIQGICLTTYSALWALDNIGDDPDLNADYATLRTCEAKWFSSHIAMDVVNATQHVHGGIGVDRDYPLHRYTLWNKHLQTSLGAGTLHLRRLGALLAN